MKKISGEIRRKIIAAAMSLVAITGTTTAVVHTAFNSPLNTAYAFDETVLNTSDDMKLTLSNYLTSAEKISSETLTKVLEECTSYGKFFAPAVSGILDMLIGGETDPTTQQLNDINDKIDKLFDKINESENTIIASVQTEIGLGDFYTQYVDFKSKTEKMARTIRNIEDDNTLSNPDKLAKIGSLAGNFYEWDYKFDDSFEKMTSFYKQVSLSTGKNVFDTIYDRNCQISMFSGEAMDKSKELCNLLMQTYSAGCSTILEVLSAQLYVNSLTDETIGTINNEYLSHISRNSGDIMNEIDSIRSALIGQQTDNGFEGRGEIAVMLENTFSKPRNILVNEGHGDPVTNLQTTLFNQNIKSIPKVNDSSKNSSIRASQQADWFNSNVYNGQLNSDTIKAIASYAAKNNKTIRELLNENGFDTSNLPDNANIITSKAWGESSYRTVCDLGHAYYKGINIDSKGAKEDSYEFWAVGWSNPLWIDYWDYPDSGNACRFQCQ